MTNWTWTCCRRATGDKKKKRESRSKPPEIHGSINKRCVFFPWLSVCLIVLSSGSGSGGGGRGAFRVAKLHHKEGNSCTETECSFGFAPPKHRLSPPISLVMSTLLIQQGAWGGPGTDGAQAHSLFPCVCRVCLLSELRGVREHKTEIRPKAENLSQLIVV